MTDKMNRTQSNRMFKAIRSPTALNKSSIGFRPQPQSKSPLRQNTFNFQYFDLNELKKEVKPVSKATKKLQNFLLPNAGHPSPISLTSAKSPLRSPLSHTTKSVWSPKISNTSNLFRQTKMNMTTHSTNVSHYEIHSPGLGCNSKEESFDNSREDTEQDFTSDGFLNRLMDKFTTTTGSNPTTTIYMGRLPKYVSIKQGQYVMQSLVDCLKFIKYTKLGKGAPGLKRHYGILDDQDDPYKKVEDFETVIDESLAICKKAINERFSRKNIEEYSKKLVEIALRLSNPGLVLYFVFTQGKLCVARGSFRTAIASFRQFKELSLKYDMFSRSMEVYKMLGRCYQALKLHKTSLIYFTKFLYMAWMRDSPKHELLAYDNIGLQYYYLGRLEKAEYFHTRMVAGRLEPKGSRLRKIGITKMKMNKNTKNMDHLNENWFYDIENDFDVNAELDRAMRKLDKDDEGDEVSFRDEGFEPPLFNVEEETENRKFLETLKMVHAETPNRRYPIKPPVTLKAIPGFVKAKVALIKKSNDKERVKKHVSVSSKNTPENSFIADNNTSASSHIRSISTAFLGIKPNEQIFTSHLSRNRGLKNFSLAGAFNPNYDEKYTGVDELDSKSCDQIRRILEKVKLNLEIIKESLTKARKK